MLLCLISMGSPDLPAAQLCSSVPTTRHGINQIHLSCCSSSVFVSIFGQEGATCSNKWDVSHGGTGVESVLCYITWSVSAVVVLIYELMAEQSYMAKHMHTQPTQLVIT